MHEIRLAGPWELLEDRNEPSKTALPCVLESPEISVRRRFHRPTGLDPGSIVRIALQATAECTVELNGNALQVSLIDNSRLVDVTAHLLEFNELVVTPAPDLQTHLTLKSAQLQILEPA